MSFIISSDSCCNIHVKDAEENNIKILPLEYIINDVSTFETLEILEDNSDFYKAMEAGAIPSTSMINTTRHFEFFEENLKENKNILHLAFDSGVSGTANAALIAGNDIKEKYPDSNLIVIDTKAGSMGQGLLVLEAIKARNEGKTLEETRDHINGLIQKVNHIFTVDHLSFLHRGGRISKAVALIGGALDIKPIFEINSLGKMHVAGKIRKRRRSLDKLVSMVCERIDPTLHDKFYVCHGNSKEDALYIGENAKAICGVDYDVTTICSVIGSHTGPNSVAVFFAGKTRIE